MILKLALRNLVINYKKNILAVLSIMAGFMSVNLFEGYMTGAKNLFAENYEVRMFFGDFIIHHKDAFTDSTFFDSKSYMDETHQKEVFDFLNSQSEVETSVRKLSFKGTIQNATSSTQIIGDGIDIENAQKIRGEQWEFNTTFGNPLENSDRDIILGEELAELIDCEFKKENLHFKRGGGYKAELRPMSCLDQMVQITSNSVNGNANALFLKVKGLSNFLYREIDSRYIQVGLNAAQNLLMTKNISSINVKLKNTANKKLFLTNFNQMIKDRKLPLVISSWKDNAFGDIYRESLSFLNVLRGFFLTVILFIVMFSILATQNRNIVERTNEIGIFRSLGFNNNVLASIFVVEAFLLSLVGCLLGLVGSIIVSYLVKTIGIYYLIGILSEEIPFLFDLTLLRVFESFFVIIGIVLFATFVPLKKAISKTIAQIFSSH